MKNVYIIGGGPAGISAALYAKRGGLDVHVFHTSKTSLSLAHRIDNYYGCPGVTGQELYDQGLKQAEALGIELHEEEVFGVELGEHFLITTDKGVYEADSVVLATGAWRNRPNIPGIRDFEGKGVSYCAVCDGFFYRKRIVAVLGNAAYANHEAEYLSHIAEKVYVLTDGKEIADPALEQFPVITAKIRSLEGDTRLQKAVFEDGEEVELTGLFVALGSAGSADLARKAGILVSDNGKIPVNENCETSVPGIYAIGDAVEGTMQVAKAVYEGMLAGNDLVRKQKNA